MPQNPLELKEAWTLVWDETTDIIPALDEYADGMLFLTQRAAEWAADHQTDLYGNGERIARVVQFQPRKP